MAFRDDFLLPFCYVASRRFVAAAAAAIGEAVFLPGWLPRTNNSISIRANESSGSLRAQADIKPAIVQSSYDHQQRSTVFFFAQQLL